MWICLSVHLLTWSVLLSFPAVSILLSLLLPSLTSVFSPTHRQHKKQKELIHTSLKHCFLGSQVMVNFLSHLNLEGLHSCVHLSQLHQPNVQTLSLHQEIFSLVFPFFSTWQLQRTSTKACTSICGKTDFE